MSELAELQAKIQDTHTAIARIERMMVDSPDLPSLLANMRSLQNRYESLKAEFLSTAQALGVDVCTYLLFPDSQKPTVMGFANALGDFQSMFSIIYDAIRNGPKARARLGEAVVKESSFGFAYAFSGSLGVVMTLPDEFLLVQEIDTAFDKVMKSIFGMAKAEKPEQILDFAHKLGPASVRALYRWAEDHAKAGLGAEIEWRRTEQVRSTVLVQRPEFDQLTHTISMTSDAVDDEFEIVGELVGADVTTHTFHIKAPEAEIRGRFADAIGPEHAVTLPKPYRAKIRKTTKIYYSTEREDESFFLLALESVE
jgi:hypothetical protein